MEKFLYKIVSIKDESPRVKSFELYPVEEEKRIFVPKAGMFIKIHAKDENGEFERSYSLASSPSSKTLELIIEMLGGRLTSKLANAKVGDVLEISGPYGFGFEETKDAIAIAGGCGVSPFIGVMKYILEKGIKNKFLLLYSCRNKEEIVKKEFFNQSFPQNIKVVITLTRITENEPWYGERGRITKEMLLKYASNFDFADTLFYISAPFEMIKAIEAMLLEIGVERKNIRYDIWGIPTAQK
jgi:ferredoxin-NADP reductase